MNRSPTVIGWDLGGAHLKVARLDPSGAVEQVLLIACPLWQGIHYLESAIDQGIAALGLAPVHAVTMTGEVVDLFASRREGVKRIVETVAERLSNRTLHFYAGRRGFLEADQAAEASEDLASANWLASASLVAARLQAAFFVDIGSTTTDLVPVAGGEVLALASNDASRLVTRELVYTGVVRTPVMAITPTVHFAGDSVPLMAELFATAADVHRLTGRLPEAADLYPAADGGEKTATGSARRLARMIGRDVESGSPQEWQLLAAQLAEAQLVRIGEAYDRLEACNPAPRNTPLVGAGVGRFLASDLATRRGRPFLDFASLFPRGAADPSGVSDCAPAVATAALAQRASL